MTAWGTPLGLYHPGDSIIHRSPVGLRLGLLTALGAALVVLRGPWSALVALALALTLVVVARLPVRSTVRGLAPVIATAAALAAYQTWQRGWGVGVELAGDLLALVVTATVVTTTTPTDVLLDLLTRAVRPLRRFGLEPETFALAVALMLRAIPALGSMFAEVRDAARARGLERSARAQLVPFAVRVVGRARTTGEALAARGIGE